MGGACYRSVTIPAVPCNDCAQDRDCYAKHLVTWDVASCHDVPADHTWLPIARSEAQVHRWWAHGVAWALYARTPRAS